MKLCKLSENGHDFYHNMNFSMYDQPADAARRLRVSARLPLGQTLDSRWEGESGRYLLRSGKPQTRMRREREKMGTGEECEGEIEM